MLVEDLFGYLKNKTDAGERIYPRVLPQGTPLPAVRYFQVSNPVEYSQSGMGGTQHPRFQFDCVGATYLQAASLAKQLTSVLNAFRNVSGATVTANATFIEDAARDDYDPDTGRHTASVDATIWYEENAL